MSKLKRALCVLHVCVQREVRLVRAFTDSPRPEVIVKKTKDPTKTTTYTYVHSHWLATNVFAESETYHGTAHIYLKGDSHKARHYSNVCTLSVTETSPCDTL